MKNRSALLSLVSLALVMGSCGDSEFKGFEKADNGLHYKFFVQDESGTKVQEGDGITISYLISKESNDSVIVDSRKVSQDGSGYVRFPMSKSSFQGSLEDGMMMMAKGDSACFIVSADSFFLKTTKANELPRGFKPGEKLKALIKIKDIRTKKELEENQKQQMAEQEKMMKEAEAKEKPGLEKYLSDNKIATKPTADGLYYIEVKKGSGPSPKPEDVVKVHYTGKLLDGTVFDTSEKTGGPAEFRLSEVIPGWVEGIQMMRKGGKAKFIVPSSLAYGPRGGGQIPPFATLVFDVELVDVNAAPVAK
jgi:FKBP-type peptidyl-prolyl cis-trans isomerase FkpA